MYLLYIMLQLNLPACCVELGNYFLLLATLDCDKTDSCNWAKQDHLFISGCGVPAP